jgi:hypothetical protein
MRSLTTRTPHTIVIPIALALMALLLAASTSCSSNKATAENQPAAPTATAITIQVTVAPTPTEVPEPTATPEPEISEDEQAVLAIYNEANEVFLAKDFDRFGEKCHPNFLEANPRTVEEKEKSYNQIMGLGGMTPQNIGFGEPKITLMMGGLTAMVEYSIQRDGEDRYPWAEFYTKYEEGWYADCV